MKICCEKTDLQAAINNVSRAAPSKSPIQAMEGILFEAGDCLRLTAYDSKLGIYTDIEANIEEKGVAVLPCSFMSELVRKLPDGMVSIDCDSDLNAVISCGKMELKVKGYNPEDFPDLIKIDEVKNVKVPESLLKSMITQTIFAVSDSEVRPIYTGVLFEIQKDEMTLVSIDGYRLAKRTEKMENEGMEFCSFVIPGSTLNNVEKICSADKDDLVSISLGEKYASFTIGKTVVLTRRLEGEFMNYRKSIPTDFRYEIIVEREELLHVIDRVSIVVKEKQFSPVKMIVNDGIIELSCVTAFGHGNEKCLCKGNGEGIRIGFNDRYFKDALKAATDENLRISFNSPTAPIIIQAEEGGNYLYMVLPIRLRDEI